MGAAASAAATQQDATTRQDAVAAPVVAAAAPVVAAATALVAPAVPSPAVVTTPAAATVLEPVLSRILSTVPQAVRAKPVFMVAAPAAAGVGVGASGAGSITPPNDLIYLAVTAVVQLGVAMVLSAVNPFPPTPLNVTPTLNLKGYNLVPNSTETVVGYYGRLSYMPGGQSLVQGQQEFDVVDPAGGGTVGSFGALVSRGLGYHYAQLLVQSNDGINVGTDPGQVPPVGSVISNFAIGPVGWSYSAMPAPGGDVVSMTLHTPFGDRNLPITFDAAAGIADHTVDNKPMQLGGGYFIAPTDPDAEVFTAVTGIVPIFTTVQGHQKFSVYDADGNSVGTFDGVFTTTKDLALNDTQAILVTANDGINVGTNVGQVPPVGSVYNVIYKPDASYVYSSLPAPTGDVVTIVQQTADGFANVTPTFIDASAPFPDKSTMTANGYSFAPTSDLVPSGVNGLPPREVEIQGYQQFDVLDSAGNKIGSVDADVTQQTDLFGIHSQVLLITNVTSGTAGSGAGDVPPVGSVFNYAYPGKRGWGTAHSTVPVGDANVTSFRILTPWGGINLPSTRKPAPDRTDVSFYSPFLV